MKNSTADIVERAKQLADLEGSNFISWNENQHLLNENYTELYQKLVNKGDKAFLKEFRCSSGVYDLPNDFMQLKGVFAFNNGNLSVINRRSENGNLNNRSYEIKNGKLYIYGHANDVLVQYFPAPVHLSTKPDNIEISLPEGTILSCYEHKFIYVADSKLYIYDLDREESTKILDDATNVENTWSGKNIVIIKDNGVQKVWDIESQTLRTLNNTYIIIRAENGNIYIVSDNKVCLYCINGDSYYLNPITDLKFTLTANAVSDDYFEEVYYFYDDNLYFNGNLLVEDVVEKDAVYKNGILYFCDNGNLFKCIQDEIFIIASNIGNVVAFTGINNKSGYGILVESGNRKIIKPYAEDVILNYPNSFFFDILAYQLAVAYKAKQGADYSQLAAQLQAMNETFFDTLGDDDFGNTRITNVYL